MIETQMPPTDSEMDHGLSTERASLVGRIAAGLAHDLNGPIGIVLGFNDLSRELLSSADENSGLPADQVSRVSEWLNLVDGAAKRARTLTQEIWEFAKSSPGEISEFDLEETVCLAARLATPALRNSGVEVSLDENQPAQGLMVTADKSLTTQTLVALLLDAPAALPAGGVVTWSIEVAGNLTNITCQARGYDEAIGEAWPIADQAAAALELQNGIVSAAPEGGSVTVSIPNA
jgi:two-component system NtrC family sensor kinase